MDYTGVCPEAIKEECNSARTQRQNEMMDAVKTQNFGTGWIPDKQDLKDEEELVIAPVLIGSKKFAAGKYKMTKESRLLMKKGVFPVRPEDKGWVPSTVR